jgi:uncharacterized protein (TIGR00290 family)
MTAAISWSGGKDSWLALARARAAGHDVHYALTMFDEDGTRSRSHAVPPQVMALQVRALNLEPVAARAPWPQYEERLIAALVELRRRGADRVIFGDIDIAEHRAFEERVCAAAGVAAELPLWREDRAALVEEMFAHGLKAIVVTTDDRFLGGEFCGRMFDRGFLAALPPAVDRCGENGEFHTFVTGGTGFGADLSVMVGPAYARTVEFAGRSAGYHFAPLRVAVERPAGCVA